MFKPVSDNIALSQKIVAQISDAIVKGSLRPGDRIPPERQLAEQFGVSRTAIRDAIKILSGGGVLEVHHGVGIFVAAQSPGGSEAVWREAKLSDIFDIRQTLETQGSAWAAERATADQITRLQSIIDDARLHQDDLIILAERDAQFHMALAETSQNLLLVKVMWNLLDALAEGRKASLTIPHRALASLDEHQEIVNAIANHDAGAARLRMEAHLSSVAQSITESQNHA